MGNLQIKVSTVKWAKAAAVRAIKTMAQVSIATIGTTAVMSEVNWPVLASTVVLSGLLSVATSVANLPEVEA